MTIIEVRKLENGAHSNQTCIDPIPVPKGWALLSESVGTPDTLENVPFGEITVEDLDGIPTVTSWTPLPVPEPEEPPEMDTGYSAEDMLRALTGA